MIIFSTGLLNLNDFKMNVCHFFSPILFLFSHLFFCKILADAAELLECDGDIFCDRKKFYDGNCPNINSMKRLSIVKREPHNKFTPFLKSSKYPKMLFRHLLCHRAVAVLVHGLEELLKWSFLSHELRE